MMLYIVRHGETDWNRQKKVQGHTDIPLNEYGRHLAEETAEGMKDIPIDIGYTSPLKRARETAEIILKGRNIPLLDEPRIQEIGFGIYEGIHTGTQEKEPGSAALHQRQPECHHNQPEHPVPAAGANHRPAAQNNQISKNGGLRQTAPQTPCRAINSRFPAHTNPY